MPQLQLSRVLLVVFTDALGWLRQGFGLETKENKETMSPFKTVLLSDSPVARQHLCAASTVSDCKVDDGEKERAVARRKKKRQQWMYKWTLLCALWGYEERIYSDYLWTYKQTAWPFHLNFCHWTAFLCRICPIDLPRLNRVNVLFTICLLASNFHLSDWPVWLEHGPEAEVYGEWLYCLVLYLFFSGPENYSPPSSHHPPAQRWAAAEEWALQRSRGSCLLWLHELKFCLRLLELWLFQRYLNSAWAFFRSAGDCSISCGVEGRSGSIKAAAPFLTCVDWIHWGCQKGMILQCCYTN